jgi:hypothetical protein
MTHGLGMIGSVVPLLDDADYLTTLCASCQQCQLKIFSSFLRRKGGQRPNDCCHESSHVCTTSIIHSVNGLLACFHGLLELAQSVSVKE